MITYEGYKNILLATLLRTGAGSAQAFLVKADFNDQDKAMLYADISEADFPGYARLNYWNQAITPDLDNNIWGRLISLTFTWTVTNIVTPQTIYGIGITKNPGGATGQMVFCINKFGAPIVLDTPGQTISRGIDFFSREFNP